jgi:hypothetical protein
VTMAVKDRRSAKARPPSEREIEGAHEVWEDRACPR